MGTPKKIYFLFITLISFVFALEISGCDRGGPLDKTPPAAPQGLKATAGDGAVELVWTANEEIDLALYRVYIAADSEEGQKEQQDETGDTTITITGLANGKTYFCWITALDTNGNESVLSEVAFVYLPTQEDFYDAAGAAFNTSVVTSTASTAFSTSQSKAATLDKQADEYEMFIDFGGGEELYDNNSCPVVTLEGNLNNLTLVISYENDCMINGVSISGRITGLWSFELGEGLTIDLDIDNYRINDVTTDGTVVLQGTATQDQAEVVINGAISTNDNTLEVSDLTAVVEFSKTGDPTQDSYGLNGTGTFTSAEDKQYSAALHDVTSDFQCFFPAAGTMDVDSSDPEFTASIDFGDGTCDTTVTVTIGNISQEIDLAVWLEQAQ